MSGRAEMDAKFDKWIEERTSKCSQLVNDFIESIENVKTAATRKQYMYYLMDFEKFLNQLNIGVLDVKPLHVEKYRNYLKKKGNNASVVNGKLSAIIAFYKFLIKNDYADKNPCDNDMKLKILEKDTVVYLTDKEVKSIKNSISNEDYYDERLRSRDLCVIQIGCSTGLRVSAIVNIDIEDIDFENKYITVIEKGNKKRNVYIGDNTIQCIKKWMNDRTIIMEDNVKGALFINPQTHKRISTSVIRRILQRETQTMNKHITPHKMRSTCAMKLYDKTGDIYLTAQQLGHANIKNTMIYAKATEEKRRMAADLLD